MAHKPPKAPKAPKAPKYKYGQNVMVNGKNVGVAKFDTNTGKALQAPQGGGGQQQYQYGQDVIVNGQNVGKAKFDTKTGKALPIPAGYLENTQAMNLPQQDQPENQNGTILGNNAGLANPMFGLSQDPNGNLAYNPVDQGGEGDGKAPSMFDNFKNFLNLQPTPPSAEDTYNKLPQKKAFEQAQKQVQNYAAQLNSIVAKSQADQLAVTGQGRGIPEQIIGGQQAQISKEAAIQALPIQALLANAQGNLELAQSHLDTVFKLKMQDAQSNFDYKTKLLSYVYDFASKSEQREFDKLETKEKQTYDEKQDAINFQRDLMQQALKDGNSAMLLQVSSLDPNSPTFNEDIASIGESMGMVSDTTNLDMQAYANQYATTGTLPSPAELKLSGLSVSDVTQMAKEMPKQKGAIVSNQTGVKSANVPAAEQSDFASLYNITQNVQRLKELDKKRVGGIISGVGGKIFGSKDQAAYLTARKAIIDDIARMQTGAALTKDEQEFYKDYLPGRYSETFGLGQDSLKKIENFENEMNAKLQNRLANYGLSIYGYSKVKVGDKEYHVGSEINEGGIKGIVLPDGNISVQGGGLSFNKEGSGSNAKKIASAIKNVESGGKYDAVGDAGTSKGAYQFNGNNFNAWSKQYFGKQLAFTPQNQDKVAEAKIQDLLDQGYTDEQVALIWNGGEPKRKKGFNKKIGLAYDSGAYADKVLKAIKTT